MGIDGADLKVHVAVRADQEPLVFEPPLETNIHGLPGELLQERLWVDRCDLGMQKGIGEGRKNREIHTVDMIVLVERKHADL